jgi:hypothetical protein
MARIVERLTRGTDGASGLPSRAGDLRAADPCPPPAGGDAAARRDRDRERYAAVVARIGGGAAGESGLAAELAWRLGHADGALYWLGHYRRWAAGRGPRERHDAATAAAELFWRLGRFAEALPLYLEARTYILVPAAPEAAVGGGMAVIAPAGNGVLAA